MNRRILLPTTLILITGCSGLSKKAQHVKIVEPIELTEMKTCKDRGEIEEVSDLSAQRAYKFLKNRAVENDANTIVSRMRVTSNNGATYKVKGRAFLCPPEVLSSLTPAKY